MAMPSITTMPTAKRIICGSAQGRADPPATENSIRNPVQPTADSRRTSDQLTARSLPTPCGVPRPDGSEKLMPGPAPARPGRPPGLEGPLLLLDLARAAPPDRR